MIILISSVWQRSKETNDLLRGVLQRLTADVDGHIRSASLANNGVPGTAPSHPQQYSQQSSVHPQNLIKSPVIHSADNIVLSLQGQTQMGRQSPYAASDRQAARPLLPLPPMERSQNTRNAPSATQGQPVPVSGNSDLIWITREYADPE